MLEPSHTLPGSPVPYRRLVYVAAVVAAAIAVLFGALMVIVFPDLLIRLGLDQLERATGVRVGYRSGRLRPSGIVLTDVDLFLRPRTPSTSPQQALRIDRVVVRPSLLGILMGHRGLPCIAFADLSHGSATLLVDEQANKPTATLDWSAIDPRHLHLWRGKPRITGVSDGRISVSAREIDGHAVLEGSWIIAGTDMLLDGLKSGDLLLEPIRLSALNTTGAWAGRRADITEFDARGSFGHVFLSGKLVLRTPLDKTGLNLHMTLALSPNMPDQLGFLLRMMLPPGSEPRDRSYHVGGTLAMPTLSILAEQ